MNDDDKNDANSYSQHHLHPLRASPSPTPVPGRHSFGSGSGSGSGPGSFYEPADHYYSSTTSTATATDARLVTPITKTTTPSIRAMASVGEYPFSSSTRRGSAEMDAPTGTTSSSSSRRSHNKQRSTGGFLLSGSLLGGTSDRSFSLRRDKSSADRKGKKVMRPTTAPMVEEQRRSHGYSPDPGRRSIDALRSSRLQTADPSSPSGPMPAAQGSQGPTTSRATAPQASQAPQAAQAPRAPQPGVFDADSAQIVSMALSLSESRKSAAATRRNMSNPLPPRLAPLPDQTTTTGGSLKQHLQQQRISSSRTVSPTPRPGPGPGPAQRHPSLPVTVETEPAYRYTFSQSTLARAQKAKDQLELMVLYRKLLDNVHPLDPSSFTPSLDRSPLPGCGRPYNPLQYIRNRKVRQRERQTISGESCGFSDVAKVTDWVNDVEDCSSTNSTGLVDVLPPFPDADAVDEEIAQSGSAKQSTTLGKPRGPRLYWQIDPADMIADVYWLEQRDHKSLIEDSFGGRIFPQDPDLYVRPASSREEEAEKSFEPTATTDSESVVPHPPVEPASTKTTPSPQPPQPAHQQPAIPPQPEHSEYQGAPVHRARERARHKLHDLKGKHRHTPSIHGADFLRLRRGSVSDSSESDSDSRRKRARKGTITADSNDVLEKQMMQLIAKEAQEHELPLDRAIDLKTSHIRPPKQHPSPQAHDPHPHRRRKSVRRKSHSRNDSRLADISDTEEKPVKRDQSLSKPSSPLISTRPSLEVPGHGRGNSLDFDSSGPNTPDFRPSRRGSGLIPPIGLDLSPPGSRPGSPSRNPFSKVKHKIFRERSRERSGESHPDDIKSTEEPETLEPPPEDVSTNRTSLDMKALIDRTRSVSPVRKVLRRTTTDAPPQQTKGHSRVGSLRIRPEEPGTRGIFKNPRIDAIIRGSVSKVGDLIWRKGPYDRDDDSDTSTDLSDTEDARGRRKDTLDLGILPLARRRTEDIAGAKHFLDTMPPFVSTPRDSTSEFGAERKQTDSPSRKRFDRLKPPKLDLPAPGGLPSLTATPPPTFPLTVPKSRDSDRSTSGSKSRPQSYIEPIRKNSNPNNNALAVPSGVVVSSKNRSHRLSVQSTRAWSIAGGSDHGSASNGGGSAAGGGNGTGVALLSRREVKRMRTLLLSTGIKAMEISRRAEKKDTTLLCPDTFSSSSLAPSSSAPSSGFSSPSSPTAVAEALVAGGVGIRPKELNALVPADRKRELLCRPAPQTRLFALAAQAMAAAIAEDTNAFHVSATRFSSSVAPGLSQRIAGLRSMITDQLSRKVDHASDDADGLSRDLVLGQRMKVRRVNEVMEVMARRKRRRFRWLRKAGWLGVEWALVGFMWYVWLVVVVVRIVLGTGRGIGRGIRWLLWL